MDSGNIQQTQTAALYSAKLVYTLASCGANCAGPFHPPPAALEKWWSKANKPILFRKSSGNLELVWTIPIVSRVFGFAKNHKNRSGNRWKQPAATAGGSAQSQAFLDHHQIGHRVFSQEKLAELKVHLGQINPGWITTNGTYCLKYTEIERTPRVLKRQWNRWRQLRQWISA